jgi:hypothetical protein
MAADAGSPQRLAIGRSPTDEAVRAAPDPLAGRWEKFSRPWREVIVVAGTGRGSGVSAEETLMLPVVATI